jgi:peptide/nickel transport system permease protein
MIEQYRRETGLDQPLPIQYGLYMSKLVRGDLGVSIANRQPVLDEIKAFLPATLELGFYSLLLSCLLGVPLGIASAVSRGRWLDQIVRVVSLFAMSMPIFWLGLVYQLVFYGQLGWLPAGERLGQYTQPPPPVTGLLTIDSLLAGDIGALGDAALHLVLPAIALAGTNLAVIARMTRSSLLDQLGEMFVTTARSKGLAERTVLYRHAFRNALIPVLTVIGLRVGELIGGAVLTETIFSWPGVGRYAVNALLNFDYPSMMAVALLSVLGYAVVNVLIDLSFYWIDPRVAGE